VEIVEDKLHLSFVLQALLAFLRTGGKMEEYWKVQRLCNVLAAKDVSSESLNQHERA